MLRFLLDEHLSFAIVEIVRALRPEISVASVLDWEDGAWRGLKDPELMRAAKAEGLTLVSYDQRSIPSLLETWAASGESHAGVVFLNRRTIAQQDFSAIAKALIALWVSHGDLDWTNRLAYLKRVP
ncbi:MAG: DUF5615 family PIN-like protein [Bryobacterales bacterium]|nr:DUF5615 family PIN-like protein [Bryobacterales bacterium]